MLLLIALPPTGAQRWKSVFWIRNYQKKKKKKSIVKGNEVDEINMLLLFGAFSSELSSFWQREVQQSVNVTARIQTDAVVRRR